MAKKKQLAHTTGAANELALVLIRTALITVLMFIFVLWFMLPRAGSTAYLWAAGFAVGILGYFVVSYYFLRRQ